MKKNISAFIAAFIFSLGLGLSGMTQPQKVKGFLDIFGSWDYSLMLVMVGAIAVHSLVYFFIKHRTSPLLDVQFHLPTRKDIDGKLILGAIIFGIGWGWGGVCPGPALSSLASGDARILFFVASMLIGMMLFQKLDKILGKK